MKKEKRRSRHLIFMLLIVGIFFSIWTLWGNKALEVNEITISSSRIPLAFSGFRIAQVSDLHNAEFGEGNATLLKMLSECDPDIIAITGDLVDVNHTDIDIALSFAEDAVRIAPTYYVTGNHEASISQYDILKSGLEAVGVTVLEDESVYLERDGETIALLGLEDQSATI